MEKTFSIQQMTLVTGLSAHTLRYYERIGLFREVARNCSSGHRSYTDRDVTRAQFIKKLRATGMPIREIVRYTQLLLQGDATITERLHLLEEHRERVEAHQRELAQHMEAITTKIALYKGLHAQQQEMQVLACITDFSHKE